MFLVFCRHSQNVPGKLSFYQALVNFGKFANANLDSIMEISFFPMLFCDVHFKLDTYLNNFKSSTFG